MAKVPVTQVAKENCEDIAALTLKVESQTRAVYRLTQPSTGVNRRDWDVDVALPNGDVDGIWTGPTDLETGFPSHPNPPTSQFIEADWAITTANLGNNATDQVEVWGWIDTTGLGPILLRDNNSNTGEFGEYWIGSCCGQPVRKPGFNDASTGATVTADRSLLDPTQVAEGIHYIYARMSDLSAFGGFGTQYTTDLTGEGGWVNFPAERSFTEKPVVECKPWPVCDPVEEGWSECPPELCSPVLPPDIDGSLDPEAVNALVVHPDQEICTGDFVDVSGRTGWTHTWTPTYNANSGTVIEDWVQISTTEVSPDCLTDITVNVTLGNSYLQLRNMWGRVWYDVQLLINGAAVSTLTFQDYHYEDDLNQTNLDDDIAPMGSAHFARANVPAGANVTVEIRRRHNFVAGGAAVAAPFGRVISGLRSHFNVHYSPTQIVTGRV